MQFSSKSQFCVFFFLFWRSVIHKDAWLVSAKQDLFCTRRILRYHFPSRISPFPHTTLASLPSPGHFSMIINTSFPAVIDGHLVLCENRLLAECCL